MENVKYTLEFTLDEMGYILVGLNSYIKNLNYNGPINESYVKAFKIAFDESTSLYIKLASYIELINGDLK